MCFYDQKMAKEPRSGQVSKISYPIDKELNEQEKDMLGGLKIWRQAMANELNLPAYMICSNSELVTLVEVRPDVVEKLATIRGFGDQKIEKLGEGIIALLNSF